MLYAKILVLPVDRDRQRFELASVGDLQLPVPTPTTKRERDSDSPRSTQSSSAGASLPSDRATAGNRRARAAHSASSHSRTCQQTVPQPQQHPSPFMFEPLPMNTDELAGPNAWAGPIFPGPPAQLASISSARCPRLVAINYTAQASRDSRARHSERQSSDWSETPIRDTCSVVRVSATPIATIRCSGTSQGRMCPLYGTS